MIRFEFIPEDVPGLYFYTPVKLEFGLLNDSGLEDHLEASASFLNITGFDVGGISRRRGRI